MSYSEKVIDPEFPDRESVESELSEDQLQPQPSPSRRSILSSLKRRRNRISISDQDDNASTESDLAIQSKKPSPSTHRDQRVKTSNTEQVDQAAADAASEDELDLLNQEQKSFSVLITPSTSRPAKKLTYSSNSKQAKDRVQEDSEDEEVELAQQTNSSIKKRKDSGKILENQESEESEDEMMPQTGSSRRRKGKKVVANETEEEESDQPIQTPSKKKQKARMLIDEGESDEEEQVKSIGRKGSGSGKKKLEESSDEALRRNEVIEIDESSDEEEAMPIVNSTRSSAKSKAKSSKAKGKEKEEEKSRPKPKRKRRTASDSSDDALFGEDPYSTRTYARRMQESNRKANADAVRQILPALTDSDEDEENPESRKPRKSLSRGRPSTSPKKSKAKPKSSSRTPKSKANPKPTPKRKSAIKRKARHSSSESKESFLISDRDVEDSLASESEFTSHSGSDGEDSPLDLESHMNDEAYSRVTSGTQAREKHKIAMEKLKARRKSKGAATMIIEDSEDEEPAPIRQPEVVVLDDSTNDEIDDVDSDDVDSDEDVPQIRSSNRAGPSHSDAESEEEERDPHQEEVDEALASARFHGASTKLSELTSSLGLWLIMTHLQLPFSKGEEVHFKKVRAALRTRLDSAANNLTSVTFRNQFDWHLKRRPIFWEERITKLREEEGVKKWRSRARSCASCTFRSKGSSVKVTLSGRPYDRDTLEDKHDHPRPDQDGGEEGESESDGEGVEMRGKGKGKGASARNSKKKKSKFSLPRDGDSSGTSSSNEDQEGSENSFSSTEATRSRRSETGLDWTEM